MMNEETLIKCPIEAFAKKIILDANNHDKIFTVIGLPFNEQTKSYDFVVTEDPIKHINGRG